MNSKSGQVSVKSKLLCWAVNTFYNLTSTYIFNPFTHFSPSHTQYCTCLNWLPFPKQTRPLLMHSLRACAFTRVPHHPYHLSFVHHSPSRTSFKSASYKGVPEPHREPQQAALLPRPSQDRRETQARAVDP